MSLELKHLSAYLPYKLRLYVSIHFRPSTDIFYLQSIDISDNEIRYMCQEEGADFIDIYNECTELSNVKPILRPLSDLDKLIKHNNEKFVPFDKMNWRPQFCDIDAVANSLENQLIEYRYFEMLVSWHFDVFGLIEKKLAVDYKSIFNKA